MTQKALVLDAIKELPDEASLAEIAERIEFLAQSKKESINSTVEKAFHTKRSSGS